MQHIQSVLVCSGCLFADFGGSGVLSVSIGSASLVNSTFDNNTLFPTLNSGAAVIKATVNSVSVSSEFGNSEVRMEVLTFTQLLTRNRHAISYRAGSSSENCNSDSTMPVAVYIRCQESRRVFVSI